VCEVGDCNAVIAHDDEQALHDKMAAFVTRCDGIALDIQGHDHLNAFGERGSSGVYYYKAGQIGDNFAPTWISTSSQMDAFFPRYDYDHDGVPAFRRHYATLLASDHGSFDDFKTPVGAQNFPVEVGSEHRGISTLVVCKDCGTSDKPRIILDYIINGIPDFPLLHGTSAPGYPLTIEGP
jgi:hypothetical protein